VFAKEVHALIVFKLLRFHISTSGFDELQSPELLIEQNQAKKLCFFSANVSVGRETEGEQRNCEHRDIV